MIIGLSRVKNEARWIRRMIASLQPICDEIIIFDDHSDDGTPEIAQSMGCRLIRSEFDTMHEARDKDVLLMAAYSLLPESERALGETSPHWAVMLDGDEELMACDTQLLLEQMRTTIAWALTVRIVYLWNDENTVRVDGIYRAFRRPSAFRLMNCGHRFMETSYGPSLHCSSAPRENIRFMMHTEARALHYGYLHQADRIRKYYWYNSIDPNNEYEDCYRHMVIGDLFPADSQFRHGGPLQLERLS